MKSEIISDKVELGFHQKLRIGYNMLDLSIVKPLFIVLPRVLKPHIAQHSLLHLTTNLSPSFTLSSNSTTPILCSPRVFHPQPHLQFTVLLTENKTDDPTIILKIERDISQSWKNEMASFKASKGSELILNTNQA